MALAAVEMISAVGEVGNIETEMIEETDGEMFEARVSHRRADGSQQAGGLFAGGSAEFEQAVVAGGEFAGDRFLEFAAALQKGVEVFRIDPLERIEFRQAMRRRARWRP